MSKIPKLTPNRECCVNFQVFSGILLTFRYFCAYRRYRGYQYFFYKITLIIGCSQIVLTHCGIWLLILYVWWIYHYGLYTCSGTNLLACVLWDAAYFENCYTMGTTCKPYIFLGNITVTFPFLYYSVLLVQYYYRTPAS